MVTGLKREARALASAQVRVVVGGADAQALKGRLDAALTASQVVGVISIGLAGALSPELGVGDWVAAIGIVAGEQRWNADGAWSATLVERLHAAKPALAAHPRGRADPVLGGVARPDLDSRLRRNERVKVSGAGYVHLGPIAAGDHMIVTAADKAALYRKTAALAVDMESHVAARFAAEHGLPFAALRVISDTADRDLPKAVLAGMKPDGAMDLFGVLKALVRHPRQLPALIRTGRDAEVAFRRLALLGGHHLLCGPGIGCPYLGQLLLDLA